MPAPTDSSDPQLAASAADVQPMGFAADAAVDGVPVFHIPAPGPTKAGLIFRVGPADETLATHGLSRLVADQTCRAVSSTVPVACAFDTISTSFEITGDADAVGRSVRALAEAIATPTPADGVGAAYEIDAIDAAADPWSTALGLRYGPNRHGLAGYPRLALEHPVAADVERWRSTRFTRSSAALWVVGTLPDTLDLSALPIGGRYPLVRPVSLLAQRPHVATGPSGTVHVGAPLDNTDAARAALQTLANRLADRLRREPDAAVQVRLAPWTDDAMYGAIEVHYASPAEAEVRELMQVELSRLWMEGPTADELTTARAAIAGRHDDPEPADAVARSLALAHLVDTGPRSAPGRVSARDLADAALALHGDALWIVPPGVDAADGRLRAVPTTSSWAAVGQTLASRTGNRTLTLAPQVVSLSDADADGDGVVSLDLPRVAAMLVHADGGRTAWGHDGALLEFHADQWHNGTAALAHLDAGVAPHCVLATARPSPAAHRVDTEPAPSVASTSGPPTPGNGQRAPKNRWARILSR